MCYLLFLVSCRMELATTGTRRGGSGVGGCGRKLANPLGTLLRVLSIKCAQSMPTSTGIVETMKHDQPKHATKHIDQLDLLGYRCNREANGLKRELPSVWPGYQILLS